MNRARGLVFQVNKNEFYLTGIGWKMFFRPKLPPEKMLDATYVSDYWQTKLIHQVSVDEGHFDLKGDFIVDRQRSGDAICGGAWLPRCRPGAGYSVRLKLKAMICFFLASNSAG